MAEPTTRTLFSQDLEGGLFLDKKYEPIAVDTAARTATWQGNNKRELRGYIKAFDVVEEAETLKVLPLSLTISDFAATTGELIIDNRGSQTKFTIAPTNFPIQGSVRIEPDSLTKLNFDYFDNQWVWQSSQDNSTNSIVENTSLDVYIDLLGVDDEDFNTPFKTFAWVFSLLRKYANHSNWSELNLVDGNAGVIKIYVNPGRHETTIHAKRLPDIGIEIIGVNDANGNKPIIDSSNITSQFNRCLFNETSSIAYKNLHFYSSLGSVPIVCVNSNRVSFEDILIESDAGKMFFMQSSNVRIIGTIEAKRITADLNFQSFCSANNSSVNFSNVGGTLTGNYNAELTITFPVGAVFEEPFFSVEYFSVVKVSDNLVLTNEPVINVDSVVEKSSYLTIPSTLR
ncbi:hypothetical protein [Coleofasciculus sp. F4-SAH-05]|uniref:hypothetical protein n=1 Tax=Coleofasciculus sp. F4-SAH-05 TaxID=3069525 RepID=UPI0032F9A2E7